MMKIFLLTLFAVLVGYKLRKFVNWSKVVSGVLLACVVIPSVLFMRDYTAGTANTKKIAHEAVKLCDQVTTWFIDKAGDDMIDELEAEQVRLQADIDETNTALGELRATSAPSSEVDSVARLLGSLMADRENVLAMKAKNVQKVNARRIEAEQVKILMERQRSSEAQFESARKIVKLTLNSRGYDRKAEAKKVAAVLDAFLDALELGQSDPKSLATPALQNELTPAKLKSLRKTAPEGQYRLNPGKSEGEVEAVFGDRPLLTLTRTGDSYRVCKVWE
ncbi:MAG: hypothetical protein KF873_03025 [Gemmataceae bacterium]|nr:hypothetical protein [Gemmataceae bacterium]